ncbi:MAG: hypothetical protein HFE63_01065 [Clostridiales bacterium]|nr:hypothetical protein [Clostridiales bacterium]
MRTINSVDDSFMRQVLTYRFVDGLTWYQVAMSVGGGNSADSIRKACVRFLAKN